MHTHIYTYTHTHTYTDYTTCTYPTPAQLHTSLNAALAPNTSTPDSPVSPAHPPQC